MVHIENGRDHFWQWDLDQRLIVDNPTVEEVHFCNAMSESALVCEVREENGARYVNVPNILLQSALCISAYSHCDGYTVVNQRFNVIERTRPDDYVYTETQVMRWQDLEQRVKDGVGYYVPNVDADGNLSWTSDNPLLPSVETVNVKGDPGAPGAPGSDANVTKENVEAALGYEPLNAAYANKIYIMQKQIENLQGIAATEETDSTEAYTKTVPTGAQKWASLDSVGGKTVVWNSQAFSGRVGSVLGVEFSVVEAGKKWRVSGTPTSSTTFTSITGSNFTEKHVVFVDTRTQIPVRSVTSVNGIGAVIFTVIDTGVSVGFVLDAGTQYDFDYEPLVIDLTQMFGAGNEPTSIDDPRIAFIKAYAEEHPEYNPGELMSAEVVEVESNGKNLLDPAASENGYINPENGTIGNNPNIWHTDYIAVSAGQQIVINAAPTGTGAGYAFYDSGKTFVSGGTYSGAYPFDVCYLTVPAGSSWFRTSYRPADAEAVGGIQLERGTVATPYSSYGVKGTFDILQSVREICPGYGWSAGTVCNEIDFGRKVYVQRVGSVDLGIFNWTLYSGYAEGVDFWYAYDDNDFIKSKLGKFNSIVTFATDGLRGINKSSSQVRIYVPTGTSAPSGLMYYELATPIEVDLSGVLPDDHYIEVEAGGTITFKQASTQLPVPSSVTYQISTKEAIANA